MANARINTTPVIIGGASQRYLKPVMSKKQNLITGRETGKITHPVTQKPITISSKPVDSASDIVKQLTQETTLVSHSTTPTQPPISKPGFYGIWYKIKYNFSRLKSYIFNTITDAKTKISNMVNRYAPSLKGMSKAIAWGIIIVIFAIIILGLVYIFAPKYMPLKL